MYMLITPRRREGEALAGDEVRRTPPYRGDIEVTSQMIACLGRLGHVARIRPSDPLGPEVLPVLMDVNLSWMSTNGFVLSGIEAIGGRLYAQSWWCRDG